MPTPKQKDAFREVTENHRSVSSAMREVGYKDWTATKPSNLTNSKGWKELMDQHFPDSLLAKKHKQLLQKEEKIVVGIGKGFSAIQETGQPHSDVAKALDMAYKLKGSYPKDGEGGNKTLVINIVGEVNNRYEVPPSSESNS